MSRRPEMEAIRRRIHRRLFPDLPIPDAQTVTVRVSEIVDAMAHIQAIRFERDSDDAKRLHAVLFGISSRIEVRDA